MQVFGYWLPGRKEKNESWGHTGASDCICNVSFKKLLAVSYVLLEVYIEVIIDSYVIEYKGIPCTLSPVSPMVTSWKNIKSYHNQDMDIDTIHQFDSHAPVLLEFMCAWVKFYMVLSRFVFSSPQSGHGAQPSLHRSLLFFPFNPTYLCSTRFLRFCQPQLQYLCFNSPSRLWAYRFPLHVYCTFLNTKDIS